MCIIWGWWGYDDVKDSGGMSCVCVSGWDLQGSKHHGSVYYVIFFPMGTIFLCFALLCTVFLWCDAQLLFLPPLWFFCEGWIKWTCFVLFEEAGLCCVQCVLSLHCSYSSLLWFGDIFWFLLDHPITAHYDSSDTYRAFCLSNSSSGLSVCPSR